MCRSRSAGWLTLVIFMQSQALYRSSKGYCEDVVSATIQFRNVSKKFVMHRERALFQELLISTVQRRQHPADIFWVPEEGEFYS